MKKQLILESGIKNIGELRKQYDNAKIYFHQDLDGVTTALAMKSYLESYGFNITDVEITQYGSREFAVKKPKFGENTMAVLVDFAHGKDWYTIHTDHHDSQTGVVKDTATSFKHSRSNVKTLSQEVSPRDIFTNTDVNLITIVDSADFVANHLKLDDVINYIKSFVPGIEQTRETNPMFKSKEGQTYRTTERNKILIGLTINKILLAFKNKVLPNGKNFLEEIVMEAEPSLTSIYNVMMRLILDNNLMKRFDKEIKDEFKDIENEIRAVQRAKQIQMTKKQLQKSSQKYLEDVASSELTDLKPLGKNASVIVKDAAGGGSMGKSGAYDRYAGFKKYENLPNKPDFQIITWPTVGLLQVSCNPDKVRTIQNVNLGKMKDEIIEEERGFLEPIRVTVGDLKFTAENDKSFVPGESVGFRKTDLLSFYNETIKGLDEIPEEFKATTDTFEPGKFKNVNQWQNYITKLMDKPYKSLKDYEKKALNSVTVSAYEIIRNNSGGHPCITNFQASAMGSRLGNSRISVREYLETTIKDKFLDKLRAFIEEQENLEVNENYFRNIIKKVMKG